MAFTGALGTLDSNFGNVALNRAPVGANPLEPNVNQALVLSQSVTVNKTVALSVSQTLPVTQAVRRWEPLTPIVGYSGSQTRYVFVRDITLGQDLYQLNQDTVFLYPASVTKIMTCLLLYEYKSEVLDSESVTFNSDDVTLPGGISSGGFQAGDICTWRELLTAIIVQSAGDACQCAARYIGTLIHDTAGSGTTGNTRFIERMNARALELGMNNTIYTDSWGYSGTGNNNTTARDNNIVGRTAFSIPTISTVGNIATYALAVTGSNPRTLNFSNVNYFVNGPTKNPSGIKDAGSLGGKVGEWNGSGTHLNLFQLWQAPNGNKIAITTFNSETYYAMTLDQQGILYQILKDWPYLDSPSAGQDPYFNNNKLLLGFDNGYTDDSPTPKTITQTATSISNTQVVKAGPSVNISTVNSFVQAPDSEPDFNFTSVDATIEVWFSSGTQTVDEIIIFSKADHVVVRREWLLQYYFPEKRFRIWRSTNGSDWGNTIVLEMTSEESQTFFNGAPRHLAIVKIGSDWIAYINGERCVNTISGDVANTTCPVTLGYGPSTNSVSAIGLFDEFRITKGVARYSANKETLVAKKFPRVISPDQPASNTLFLGHTVKLNRTINVSVSQTLTLTCAAYKVTDVSASSSITLSHTVAVKKVRFVSASSSLALSQTVSRSMSYGRMIFQGLNLVHTATRNMYYLRAITQPVNLVQTHFETNSKLAYNTLVLSQLATFQYSRGARNALELTQQVSRSITKVINLHDFLGVFHRVSTIGTYNKKAEQVLALSQTVVATVTKSVKHTLNLSDLAIGEVVTPAFSTLALFDAVVVVRTTNQAATNQLIMNQSVGVVRSLAVKASNALGLSQLVKVKKVILAMASNTLNLTQDLVRERFNKSASNTLALSQVASAVRIINVSVTHTLPLTQTLVLSKTITRSLVDELVFKHAFIKYTGIASQPYVSVPEVQVVVLKQNVPQPVYGPTVTVGVHVKTRTQLILEGPGLSIVLPSPQFNDGEAGNGKLTVKRAMDGTRRIYRRDNPTSKLKYDFVMDRLKAIELRNFIMSQNSNVLRLTNHKAEIWYVLLTNSPFTLTEASYWQSSWGNKSTVTLELEGTRVN